MMRVLLVIDRDVVFDGAFNGFNGFTWRDAGAVANAKNVRVDGLRWMAPPHVQHDIGCLAPYTR